MLALIISVCSLVIVIRRLGILEKDFNKNALFMFTNMSILLCAVYYTISLFFIEESYMFSCMKFYLMLYMLLVGIVYNFILVPQARIDRTDRECYSFFDCIAHIFLPLAIFWDYMVHTVHYKYSILSLFLSLVYPLLYGVLIFAKAKYKLGEEYKHSNTYYPYFFLDMDKLGKKKVAENIGKIVLAVIFVGLLLLFINNVFLIQLKK